MGIFDLIRSPSRWLSSPATRRLYEAERAAEVWSSAPAPNASAPATPGIGWTREQPPAPPTSFTFRPGYSDHTYEQFSAPLAFDGFSLDRIRAATTMHRTAGNFFETSALMVAVLGYAPVLAALQQAIAPILALQRHIHGGEKGLARLVASEIEEQLLPSGGLLPSPYFPPTTWGTTAIHLRMMGFGCWQHIDGDMDPETGVRPRYTRIWQPWAVQRTRSPRKAIAFATSGPIEICNDGKFTLIESVDEGHLHQAAVLAVAPEAATGKLTQEARLRWLDFFSSPKLVGVLPEHVPTEGKAGDAFLAAVDTIFGPDGRGVVPYGGDVKAISIAGEGADQFNATIIDGLIHVFMVLTGSAGTIGNGAPAGGQGVPYQPAKGGAWTVRHDLIAQPAIALATAANQGHVAPYCDQNYGEAIARAKRAGAWKYPVLEIPVPAPDREERIANAVTRYKALTDQVTAEKAAGAIVDQPRVDKLAEAFEVKPFTLADADPKVGEIREYHITNKIVAPDQVLARLGLPPLPNGAGSPERLAQERLAGGDETGALAKVDAAEAKDGAPEDAAAEEEAAPEAQRNPPVGDPKDDDEQRGPGTQRSGPQGGSAT